ncbi:MAG: trypsin-like peptidase domain-containing protein [Desulfomonile tiedjei]|nr:trypsin-like peptidase domain-containing protein [Desulfomonile tiedjei]
MRRYPMGLWCLVLVLQCGLACAAGNDFSTIETQVLRVFAVKKSPYYHKPWKSPDFTRAQGSAFFFKDDKNFPRQEGLILTNAHAVSMGQSFKVSNGREKREYNVKLLGVCDTADFAVLQMEPEDLKAMEQRNGKVIALELGDSDPLRVGDKVLGWGYPLGGERLSKSEQGEISRIEVNKYAHSGEYWLMVQASLQQNQGNSGGPVLQNGKVVGISFQGMSATDRINYFIPINLVKHLLPLLNQPDQIPQWRYVVQEMFPALKDYYTLGADQGGVLMAYLIPDGAPYQFGIQVNDILMELDGHEIDNFGETFFKPLGQKIHFTEILNRKQVGDPLTATVIRAGQRVSITGTMGKGLPRLVPKIFTGANYFIFGGIGFVELTMNCIENLGKSGDYLRQRYAKEFPKRPYEKIVVISEIFPEYGLVNTASYLRRVEKIDEEKILNLQDLYDRIQSLEKQGKKKALLQLSRSAQLPLDLERAASVDQVIREKYGILYMKTPDKFHH